MNRLVILCGIPGSGKSTYAKELLKLHPEWKYVSRDEVRYEFVSDQEHYFDRETDVYKEFCNRISMHLINGNTVIADATHISKASRIKLMNSLDIQPDEVIVVVLNTPFQICKERNSKRVGITRVPDDSMFRMKNKFKSPDARYESYIDKIVYVSY